MGDTLDPRISVAATTSSLSQKDVHPEAEEFHTFCVKATQSSNEMPKEKQFAEANFQKKISNKKEPTGRKPSVSEPEILQAVLKYKSSFQQGVPTPSDSLWSALSIDLKNRISAKAIYNCVKCNRYNIHSILGIASIEKIKDQVSRYDQGSSDLDYDHKEKNSKVSGKYEEFSFKISRENWKAIEPVSNFYVGSKGTRNRERKVLPKRSWTHIINSDVWYSIRKPCTWVYKQGWIKLTTETIFISAACKQCNAKLQLNISIPHEMEDGSKLCEGFIVDFEENFKHKPLKRPVSGSLRNELATQLKYTSAIGLKRKIADNVINYGEAEASHVPSEHVLRQVHYEDEMKHSRHKDPIISLKLIKYLPPYYGAIHDIGADPLFVHYWNTIQVNMYKEFCLNEVSSVTIDATGSLARVPKLNLPPGLTYKVKPLFLYQMMAKPVKDTSFPVTQMLTQRHDAFSIQRWLEDWMRCNAPVPKEAICDDSGAILLAMSRAFCGYDNTRCYLEACFQVLNGNDHQLPRTFLRLDVAHFINRISKWTCFRHRDIKLKEFYIRCIGVAVNTTSFEELKNIFEYMITLALSDMVGWNNGNVVLAEIALQTLKCKIAGENTDDVVGYSITEFDVTDVAEIPNDECESTWFHTLKTAVTEKLKKSPYGDRENFFFLPDFVKELSRLSLKIALWSGIMQPFFGYGAKRASSVCVESYFKDLKCLTFKSDKKKMRVDHFVTKHLDSLRGHIKLAAAEVIQKKENSYSHITRWQGNVNDGKETEDQNDFKTWHPKVEGNSGVVIKVTEEYKDKSKETVISPDYLKNVSKQHFEDNISSATSSAAPKKQFLKRYQIFPRIDCNVQYEETASSKNSKAAVGEEDSNWCIVTEKDLEEENWRGQNSKKRQLRYSYLYPKSDWLTLSPKKLGSKRSAKLGILKNGSTCPPLLLKKQKYMFINTCSFDSVIQAMSVCYCDSKIVKNAFHEKTDVEEITLAMCLAEGPVSKPAYELRGKCLLEKFNFQIDTKCNIHLVNCETSIWTIVSLTVGKHYPTATEIIRCSSNNCTSHYIKRNLPVLSVVVDDGEIGALQNTILEKIQTSVTVCKIRRMKRENKEDNQLMSREKDWDCNGTKTISCIMEGPFIFIEVTSINQNEHYDVDLVPIHITLRGINFELKSILHFIAPKNGGLGHFITFCRRPLGKWEVYDDLSRDSRPSNIVSVCPHLLLYVKSN